MPLPIETEITHIEYGAHVDLPADAPTAQDMAALDARLDTLEAHGLGDHPDVDKASLSAAAAGSAVVKGGNGKWGAAPVTSGTVATVRGSAMTPNVYVTDVNELSMYTGFKVSQGSVAGRAVVEVDFDAVAEKTHAHTLYTPLRFPFGFAADDPPLSSGTRELVSAQISLPSGIATVVDVTAHVHVQGVNDVAKGNLIIAIDGNSSSSASIGGFDVYTYEWGVNTLWAWDHFRTLTGDGTTKTVSLSVQRTAGDIQVINGWITVRRSAAR